MNETDMCPPLGIYGPEEEKITQRMAEQSGSKCWDSGSHRKVNEGTNIALRAPGGSDI